MATKLIPLKLLTDGQSAVSFMLNNKHKDTTLWLARSIVKDGLLNPLVVIKQGSKFVVLDGKKRLAIIRRMAKNDRLNKAIAKVPCVVQETHTVAPLKNKRPILLTGPELAHQIILDGQAAKSHAEIAQRFECSISVVEDSLSLRKLNPEILLHFNKGAISLEQAAALATIENMTAQLDLLHQLGPFVSDKDIISAIRAGATVVELSDNNIIFLPSRGRPAKKKPLQRKLKFGKTSRHAARYSVPLAA